MAIKRSIRPKPVSIFLDARFGHDDFESVVDLRMVVSCVDESSRNDSCAILAVKTVDEHRLSLLQSIDGFVGDGAHGVHIEEVVPSEIPEQPLALIAVSYTHLTLPTMLPV